MGDEKVGREGEEEGEEKTVDVVFEGDLGGFHLSYTNHG